MRDYVYLVVEAFKKDFPEQAKWNEENHCCMYNSIDEYWDVHYHPVTQEVFIYIECEYLRIPQGHKKEFIEKARLIISDYYEKT